MEEQQEIKTEKRYLTEKEAFIYTSLSPSTLKRARLTGELIFIQRAPGCSILYDKEDIDKYLSKLKSDKLR